MTGCASYIGADSIASRVSSYSRWPAQQPPGTFAFETLPSVAPGSTQQKQLQDAAGPALERTGFVPVAPGQTPDFRIQLGMRITDVARSAPFDDPFWLAGGRWRQGRGTPGFWPGWQSWIDPYPETADHEREVAVLIRRSDSSQAVYEAHASNDASGIPTARALPAMFSAALADFPKGSSTARRIIADAPRP